MNSILLDPRSRFRRLAVALAALAHVMAFVIAPVIGSTAERSAAAHVEQAGTSEHHAHSDATCIVCAAHSLVANASSDVFRLTAASMRDNLPAAFVLPTHIRVAGSPVGSRAPPNIA
ncbi:MAG TPA: hypothetical protein VMM77_06365 [Gemmatimonadaceae bacterium]|nr:hypothetical protein [Gemmatimonadaceae bacterium]